LQADSHIPATQDWPGAQTAPQVPQFFGSLNTLLHPVLQQERPPEQVGPPLQPVVAVQLELRQDPLLQTLPQPPQFFGSLVVSMHPSPGQQLWPGRQLQMGVPQMIPFGVFEQH
jgi:hypothetical protein